MGYFDGHPWRVAITRIQVIGVRVNRVKMTDKWGQIQRKWDLVRVSGGVRVIRVRVSGVLLYIKYPVLIVFAATMYVITSELADVLKQEKRTYQKYQELH